jgi:hypothetical protein
MTAAADYLLTLVRNNAEGGAPHWLIPEIDWVFLPAADPSVLALPNAIAEGHEQRSH